MKDTWLFKYMDASFRKVPFYVESHETSTAHRKNVITLPGSNSVQVQNMGRDPKRVTIDCYVLGDDYFTARDSLAEALDKDGPGELVHPYQGTQQIEVLDWSMKESSTEGRVARFQISYVVLLAVPIPALAIAPALDVLNACDAFMGKASAAFLTVYSIARKPFAMVAAVQNTLSAAHTLLGYVKKTLSLASELEYDIKSALQETASLVKEGKAIAESIVGISSFGLLSTDNPPITPASARDQFNGFLLGCGFRPKDMENHDKPQATSPFKSKVPSDNVQALMTSASIAALGKLITEMEFTTFEDAISARDAVFTYIDQLLMNPDTPSEVYVEAYRMKKTIQRYIESKSDSLTRSMTVTYPQSVPALVASYNLYGHINEADNITRSNNISHPGFIVGSSEIKVRTHA